MIRAILGTIFKSRPVSKVKHAAFEALLLLLAAPVDFRKARRMDRPEAVGIGRPGERGET
jgi:hypothetical protein